MKKPYDSPKAEKVDFNYKEVVVASDGSSGKYMGGTDAPNCFTGKHGAQGTGQGTYNCPKD